MSDKLVNLVAQTVARRSGHPEALGIAAIAALEAPYRVGKRKYRREIPYLMACASLALARYMTKERKWKRRRRGFVEPLYEDRDLLVEREEALEIKRRLREAEYEVKLEETRARRRAG